MYSVLFEILAHYSRSLRCCISNMNRNSDLLHDTSLRRLRNYLITNVSNFWINRSFAQINCISVISLFFLLSTWLYSLVSFGQPRMIYICSGYSTLSITREIILEQLLRQDNFIWGSISFFSTLYAHWSWIYNIRWLTWFCLSLLMLLLKLLKFVLHRLSRVRLRTLNLTFFHFFYFEYKNKN